MERILIVGGGVGGTLTAICSASGCGTDSRRARSRSRSSTRPASMSTSPASCTSRWAASEQPHSSVPNGVSRPSRDARGGRGREGRRADSDGPPHRRRAAGLRLPRSGHGLAHRPRGDRPFHRPGLSLLHGRGGHQTSAAAWTPSRAGASSSASRGCRTNARRRRSRWPS